MHKAVIFVLFLGSLFLTGCGKKPTPSNPPPSVADNPGQKDMALRSLLGVKGMDTEFRLPDDEPYYCITTLKFEDGKRLGEGTGSLLSHCDEDNPTHKQRVHLQFLWREENPKAVIFQEGTTMTFEDPFWQKLNFASNTPPPTAWEGYTILGFATSNMGQDGQVHNSGTGDFRWELKDKKYLGALVMKTFKTERDLRKFLGLNSEGK